MIEFPTKVVQGTFIRRYKRFFADILLENGEEVVAHTPNTGSMKGLLVPNSPCILSHTPSPKRKLHYTLQALKINKSWVGCNTGIPNKLIFKAIEDKQIPSLTGYKKIQPEVVYGKERKSRIDLFLSEHPSKPDAFVEIKNVTLKDKERALFPDAVSTRGLKHLNELEHQISLGLRAVMIFLIQRTDCSSFSPADEIDRAYGQKLRQVYHSGVEVLCLTAAVKTNGVELLGEVPLQL